MAWTDRYANFDLTTGANDGTSESDAWQTIAAMAAGVAAGNRVNIKRQSAGYNLTSTVTLSTSGTATSPIWYRAYETTPGDGGLWEVRYNTGSTASLQFTGDYVYVEGVDFQPGASTNINVLDVYGIGTIAIRCRAVNTGDTASYGRLIACDIEMDSGGSHRIRLAGTNSYPIIVSKTRLTVTATTNTSGILFDCFGRGMTMSDCVVIGNGTVDGIFIDRANDARNVVICNSRFYDFASAIIVDEEPNAAAENITVCENVFEACSSYAVERTNAEAGYVRLIGNRYYDCTSGFTNYATEAEPLPNESLSGSPFVDAAGGDFSLNNTAGAGAVCRAAGFAINEPYDWSAMSEKAVYEGSGGGGGFYNPFHNPRFGAR